MEKSLATGIDDYNPALTPAHLSSNPQAPPRINKYFVNEASSGVRNFYPDSAV
jgi:hypothetical protein